MKNKKIVFQNEEEIQCGDIIIDFIIDLEGEFSRHIIKKCLKTILSKHYKTNNMTHIIDAHKHSRNNRENLTKSYLCGCFCCLRIFKTSEIVDWTDNKDKDATAVCPYCSVDSIISENSGYSLTIEFLSEMKKYWFKIE